MENILNYIEKVNTFNESPLASRIRPTTLDEVVGQEDILGKNKLLYKMIENDKLSSIIFYGPPGTGKTTIARVIANTTQSEFVSLNATNASKKDMEDVIVSAKNNKMINKKTILFIDEIHRFNKAQQDFLLPFVEDATIILIGATTENPYFEVNSALLSRAKIFELKPLSDDNIKNLIKRACYDKEKGLGAFNININEEAINYLAMMCNGDARIALNTIELASRITKKNDSTDTIDITIDIIKECIGKHSFFYDKNSNEHYDTISAFIKSMRGSDANASIYYLARMLNAGEDIKFIARRIMICASEDVGLADPMALVIATSASLAIERVGMPEAQIILSQAVMYIANAKKSNSCYLAIDKANEIVKNTGNLPIPKYLQDAHYKGAKELNKGIGYKYPHDYENNFVEQQYLPNEIKDIKICN